MAADRGIPDGLRVEELAWRAFRESRKEASECRRLATVCEERGLLQLSAADDENARKWFDLVAKFKMGAAKAIDVQSKILKLAMTTVQMRERTAATDRLARIKSMITGAGDRH